MPKVSKPIRAAALSSVSAQHQPLMQVVERDDERRKYAAPTRRHKDKNKRAQGDGEDDEYLDEKTSQRILSLSREQQMEEVEEEGKLADQRQRQAASSGIVDSDEEEGEDVEDALIEGENDEYYIQNDDQGYVEMKDGALGLSAEDEAIIASMMGGGDAAPQRRTLADMIMEKIAEKESIEQNQGAGGPEDVDEDELPPLPEKVVEVYTEIGKILSRYTSGKLPKAFKVIPSLSNWEQILALTRPDQWTPQAMYAATRIFASNLNPKMAQRFYNLVLLDAVRADIYTHKKLNYHYYIALKKSVYKPAAFFKGILLPLSRSDDVTLREAAIIASVIQRVSIPVHHSAVALHKLAQPQAVYHGAASIFIKTLLDKKYALPAPVIASLVQHFASFVHHSASKDGPLPVLWHQALLVFCQRYKREIVQRASAREALRQVMKKHSHPKITPEVRRELFGAQAFADERRNLVGKDGDSMVT